MPLSFFTGFVLFLFSLSSAAAAETLPSRRQLFGGIAACIVSALHLDPPEEDVPAGTGRRRWSLRPDSDIETLGLESFGIGVREVLKKEGMVDEKAIFERIRWHLQEGLWRVLEPKTPLLKSIQVQTTVAIWIGKDTYVYFSPSFRIRPLSSGSQGPDRRTVGKIEYLNEPENPRSLTYWIDGPPKNRSTLILGPEIRRTRVTSPLGELGP